MNDQPPEDEGADEPASNLLFHPGLVNDLLFRPYLDFMDPLREGETDVPPERAIAQCGLRRLAEAVHCVYPGRKRGRTERRVLRHWLSAHCWPSSEARHGSD